MADQEKPFKTIEVVDSRTNQVCKVACMSCIRGHRTTSCGIPVCRSKIFWTVKRPGRPSNSCTCRYGATGGCKCVVARSACPHKSKKGEKRTGECRCDEQGRYCCLLEPEHWNSLLSLQKPKVDFFSTREALETKQAAASQASLPPTPAYSGITSPQSTYSVPNTPGPNGRMQPPHIMPAPYHGYPPTGTTLTPRFGMMGIGAGQGSQQNVPSDVLVWEGHAPQAPREYRPIYENLQSDQSSCCQPSTPTTHSIHSPTPGIEPTFAHPQPINDVPVSQPYNGINGTHEMPLSTPLSPAAPPAFDFNRLQMDYFNYQFPSAICQNCGLSGCTCKNCPPVFQNYGTGSWAQCCGRKHARDAQPTPVPQKVARSETYNGTSGIHAHAQPPSPGGCCGSSRTREPQMTTSEPPQQRSGCCGGSRTHAPEPFQQHPQHQTEQTPFSLDTNHFGEPYPDLQLQPPGAPPDFQTFDLDHDFLMPDGTDPLDINDFLLSDLDQSHTGLDQHSAVDQHPPIDPPPIANGDEISGGGGGIGRREDVAGGSGGGGGGGGGCCCGGP